MVKQPGGRQFASKTVHYQKASHKSHTSGGGGGGDNKRTPETTTSGAGVAAGVSTFT